MADYSWLIPLLSGAAKAGNSYAAAGEASSINQAAFQKMLDNIQARYGELDKMPAAGYQDLNAQQLGPSALEGIQVDPQGKVGEQQAVAGLDELTSRGGLGLSDMKALNDVQQNLSRNDQARRASLANDFASRGQLGSGAQLGMALQGQQQAASSANDRAESIAGQAQQRVLEALMKKAGLSRDMTNDQYQRDANAAKAKDLIAQQNAIYRTDASKYNNSLKGQTYDDALNKLKMKVGLTGDLNDVTFRKGQNQANTTMGMAGFGNSLIDSGAGAIGGAVNKKTNGGSDSQKAGDDAFNSDDTTTDSSTDDTYDYDPEYGGD